MDYTDSATYQAILNAWVPVVTLTAMAISAVAMAVMLMVKAVMLTVKAIDTGRNIKCWSDIIGLCGFGIIALSIGTGSSLIWGMKGFIGGLCVFGIVTGFFMVVTAFAATVSLPPPKK